MNEDKRQFVSFRIGEHYFGVDIHYIKEVYPEMDFSPTPLAPPYIKGLLNVRGQVVEVIDTAIRLNIDSRPITENSRNIIFKQVKEPIAILVDNIENVIEVEENDIDPPPKHSDDIDSLLIEGVLKYGKDLISILNIQRLLWDKY